jgi:hypothetical protein
MGTGGAGAAGAGEGCGDGLSASLTSSHKSMHRYSCVRTMSMSQVDLTAHIRSPQSPSHPSPHSPTSQVLPQGGAPVLLTTPANANTPGTPIPLRGPGRQQRQAHGSKATAETIMVHVDMPAHTCKTQQRLAFQWHDTFYWLLRRPPSRPMAGLHAMGSSAHACFGLHKCCRLGTDWASLQCMPTCAMASQVSITTLCNTKMAWRMLVRSFIHSVSTVHTTTRAP